MKAERSTILLSAILFGGTLAGAVPVAAEDDGRVSVVASGRPTESFGLPESRVVTFGAATDRGNPLKVSDAADSLSSPTYRRPNEGVTLVSDTEARHQITPHSVPEPAPLALLGVGVLGLSVARRRAD